MVWIGVRPERRTALVATQAVLASPDDGLEGDHYKASRRTRQVTLIGREQLAAIASFLGTEELAPERLRRNVVVSGINLAALCGRRFRVGSLLLDATGNCHPCSRMEEEFGPGGYNAVRGHGGITARIVVGGTIRVGDRVQPADDAVEGL